jgi:hypothetical protein
LVAKYLLFLKGVIKDLNKHYWIQSLKATTDIMLFLC